jgi:hypothetical protein
VVTREVEFDEETRTLHEALTYYDDLRCGRCGNDLEQSTVPNRTYMQDHDLVCGGCAVIELTERELREAHEKDSPPDKGKAAYMEGRIVTARLIDPEDGGDDGD